MCNIIRLLVPLLILVPVILKGQTDNIISYSLQLKGQELNVEEYYSSAISYSLLGEDMLKKMAVSFTKNLFNQTANNILHHDELDSYYGHNNGHVPISDKLELLEKGKQTSQIYYKYFEEDTLYIKNEWDEFAYMSRDGKFDFYFETVEEFDAEKEEYSIVNNVTYRSLTNDISGLKFYESWDYNYGNGVLTKQVKSLLPFIADYNLFEDPGYYARILLEFGFEMSRSNKIALLGENIVYDVPIVPDLYTSCDDIDNTDVEEELHYLETTQRNKLIVGLLNSLKSGKVMAYKLEGNDANNFQTTKGKKMLNYSEVIEELSTSFIEGDEVSHSKLENIVGIRFYEDWYFDDQRFSLSKKVKAVSLIVGAKKQNMETREYEPIVIPKLYIILN